MYIFFGHGWDMNSTFNVSKRKNISIILLRDKCCLMETPINHLTLLAHVGKIVDDEKMANELSTDAKRNVYQTILTSSDYLNIIVARLERQNNILDVYNSNVIKDITNMVLSTYAKKNELTRLQRIGDIRPTPVPEILTLEELVNRLEEDVILIIYACRTKIDNFQLMNIPECITNGIHIVNFIHNNKISIQD